MGVDFEVVASFTSGCFFEKLRSSINVILYLVASAKDGKFLGIFHKIREKCHWLGSVLYGNSGGHNLLLYREFSY